MTTILRVFPRRTKATPEDELAFIGDPPLWHTNADEVHISCTFTWDRPEAERLADSWSRYYPVVKVGGPAYDDPGADFTPGFYLKTGHVITSRGCPNRCDFCFVPKREGPLRTLPIRDGYIVNDNNLLACPASHIHAVFDMLSRQKRRAEFVGGLEARRITTEIVKALIEIRFNRAYLAYDTPSERRPLAEALAIFREHGIRHQKLSVYVLVGFEGDTVEAAAERCQFVKDNGAIPYPMFYRPDATKRIRKPLDWADFQAKLISKPGIRPKESTLERQNGQSS